MASSLAAITTGGGGLVSTADSTGNLDLKSGTTTIVALTSAGAAVTGDLSATGITTVAAGTAALPAVVSATGTADTGLWFPAADTVAASTGGTERLRIDSSGNVGIGTTAPRSKLSVTNGTENTSGDAPQEAIITGANQAITAGLGILTVQSNTAIAADVGATIALGGRIRNTGTTTDASNFAVIKGAKENATSDNSAGYFAISTKPNGVAPVERMRIDSSGNVLVGTTAATGSSRFVVTADTTSNNPMSVVNTRSTAATDYSILFYRDGSIVGSVQTSLSATSYVTSSDYRLKEDIQPMTGALAKVALLKPCTFNWKVDGSNGQGFIAHELQAVVPDCVTGEKDGVETYTDEDGNEATRPVHQGIDTSFLVATLTASIQELKAIIDTQAAQIAALNAKVGI